MVGSPGRASEVMGASGLDSQGWENLILEGFEQGRANMILFTCLKHYRRRS